MTKLNTLKALQKAEVLQMRGRGCCGYGDDDFDIDFGCFDWEVICTPDGGYTVEYDPDFDWGDYNGDCYEYHSDIDRYETIYLTHQYDYAAHEFELMRRDGNNYDSMRTWAHDKIDGDYAVGDIKNGDAPLIMDEKTMECLLSTGISAHEIALNAVQQAAKDGTVLASIGKMARGVGTSGAIVGAFVAFCDLEDGHRTPQDWGQAVGSALGLGSIILGACLVALVVVTAFGIGSMAITFFAYCLDDSADHQETKY